MSWEYCIDIIKEWVLSLGYATQAWVTANINILKIWVIAQGYLTTGFVDRGDPASPDFDEGDLDLDGDIHELDISGIVPAGAKAILFNLYGQNDNINTYAYFRAKEKDNTRVMSWLITQVADQRIAGDRVLALGVSRTLEYKGSDGGWDLLHFTIKGWWL